MNTQAGQHGNVAADIVTLSAFVRAGPDDAVIHQHRIDTRALEQSVNAMCSHVIRTGGVEFATEGLGQTRADAVYNNYFAHRDTSELGEEYGPPS